MRKKNINNLYPLLLSSALAACSSGGNSPTSGNVSSLIFTQPYELSSFQNTSGNGYIVISNSDESRSVGNISYSLNSVVGGAAKVSIDSTSAESCAVIESLSSCILKLNLESGAFGGSFVVGASNNSNLLSRIKQSLSTSPETVAKAPIGINTVATTTASGINGIQLSYYTLVSNDTALVVIVGTVLSNNTGTFNNAVLLDENNQPLALQNVISDNLGAGAANLKQGDSFSITIPAPLENKPLSFKLEISEVVANGTASNIVTSATLNTLSSASNQAILYNYPSSIGLNPSNVNQTLAVANIGSVAATVFTVSSSNPSVATVTEPAATSFMTSKSSNRILKTDVPTASISSYMVSLTDPSSPQNVSFSINQSYNNGKTEVTTSIAAISSNSPWPSPSPTPTPTPSPTPSPSPVPSPTPSPSPVPKQSKFAYMIGPDVDLPQTDIVKCDVDQATAAVSNCARIYPFLSATPQSLTSISFTEINSSYKAYITQRGVGGQVYRCDYSSLDGNLSNCIEIVPSSVPAWDGPYSLAFYTASNSNNYVYIATGGGAQGGIVNGIYRCSVNNDGSFANDCAINGGLSNFTAYNITLHVLNGVTYVYYINGDSNKVNVCTIDNNADITACTEQTNTGPGPAWINFESVNEVPYAYITDNSDAGFRQCSLNNNGTFNDCTNVAFSGNGVYAYIQFSFVSAGTNLLAYIAGYIETPPSTGVGCYSMNTNTGAISTVCTNYVDMSTFQQINSFAVSPAE